MAVSATRLGLAGGIATLLGIGMARFAYTPLIPALVEADWFTIHAANYLGAINLLGYLIGAAGAHQATRWFGVRAVLAGALAVTVASFYACALDWGVLWYGVWRLACGASGAALVVVGVPAALSRVAPAERPTTGALVFSGIGLGIAASGTLVPWLAGQGVAMVLYPLSASRALANAALDVYATIREHGTQKPALATMQTRKELYSHLGYHQFEDKLDQLFGHKKP